MTLNSHSNVSFQPTVRADAAGRELPNDGTPRRAHGGTSIFRGRALAARARHGVICEPLRICPLWASWVVAASALIVAVSVVVACVVDVEVTSVGRGIVRAANPPRILATEVAGTVVSVSARTGDHVRLGQEVARLESASTASRCLEASRRLELAESSLANFREQRKPLYLARQGELRARAGLLGRRAASESSSVSRMLKRGKDIQSLEAQGILSRFDALEDHEKVAGKQRDSLRVQEERAEVGEALAALDAALADEEWRLTAQVAEARLQHDSLKFALDAATVRAPIEGIIGSISARPGDPLSPGAPLGSVVEIGAPRMVVAYVPERDRAFIEAESRVRVEVDQLPIWEFPALRGRVIHVASEIASERDLRDTLGDQARVDAPQYRVEIELERDEAYTELQRRLRPESLASVRFTLRQRRIITILFEPLYRWLH